jgi:hypothetical protein
MINYLILILLFIRRSYAMWAMQYVPMMINGQFNSDWERLHEWANCERCKRYLEHGEY